MQKKKKTKASEISTGPTTSSRHSKTKGTHLVLGLLQVVGTVKKKTKALILVLGLLQVVGTVKN